MNWYKKAQLNDTEIQKAPEHYLEIGHGEDPDDLDCEASFLWIWAGGMLLVEEVISDNIHWNYWDDELIETSYSGRYDGCLNQISISLPLGKMARFRDIPSSLVQQLKSQFSPDAQMYAFRDQSPEYPTGVERVANSHRRILNAH